MLEQSPCCLLQVEIFSLSTFKSPWESLYMCACVTQNAVIFKFALQGVLLMAHFSMSHISQKQANMSPTNKAGAEIWVLLWSKEAWRFWR